MMLNPEHRLELSSEAGASGETRLLHIGVPSPLFRRRLRPYSKATPGNFPILNPPNFTTSASAEEVPQPIMASNAPIATYVSLHPDTCRPALVPAAVPR
jgi:hypothetical protein